MISPLKQLLLYRYVYLRFRKLHSLEVRDEVQRALLVVEVLLHRLIISVVLSFDDVLLGVLLEHPLVNLWRRVLCVEREFLRLDLIHHLAVDIEALEYSLRNLLPVSPISVDELADPADSVLEAPG